MDGQGDAQRMGILRPWIAAAVGVVALAVTPPAHAAQRERQTPSGMPVPRYVSLKFDKVNARAGPGDDHRLMWVYRVKGLPVQVVAETSEWRRICDPEGSLVWVHKRTTDGRRMVMNTHETRVTLLRRPRPDAKAAAFLNSKALAALDRCEKGWCRVHVAGVSGWTREGDLWGTAPAPQCH